MRLLIIAGPDFWDLRALLKRRSYALQDQTQHLAEGDWDFTVSDVEQASRLFHSEENEL